MYIEALDGCPPAIARGILAAALLADIRTADEQVDVVVEAKALQVLKQVRQTLGIASGEASREATEMVRRAISEELAALVVSKSKLLEAIERSGTKGTLPIDRYSISFSTDFNAQFGEFGESERAVLDLIRRSSDVHHFKPIEDVSFPKTLWSILGVVENFGDKKRWTFIIAERDGSSLTIEAVWRYVVDSRREHDDITTEFLNFLHDFGFWQEVGPEMDRTLFVLYKTITVKPKEPIVLYLIPKQLYQHPPEPMQFGKIMAGEGDTFYIAFFYTIDAYKYRMALTTMNAVTRTFIDDTSSKF